ncbi:transposase [Patescibacteria group bacterium]|nr:transposase [Patescibacteria group bacterium]
MRRKVKFVSGKIYHIFDRGVEKRNIFNSDNDRWRFLHGLFLFNNEKTSSNLLYQIKKNEGRVNFSILKRFVNQQNNERTPLVRIIADCLMPNHYHLLIEEIKKGGISKFMHRFGGGYATYFNKKYERVGSLFQGPFKAVSIENDIYLKHLLVYINLINPAQLIEPNLKEKGVKDIEKIMKFAENYQWSTHPEYLNNRESIIIEKGILGEFFPDPEKYREFAKDVLISKKYDIINNFILE